MRSIKWRCFRCFWVTPDPQTTAIFAFSSLFISSQWVNIETSCLVYRLIVAIVPAYGQQKKLLWKGRAYVTRPVLNFWAPSISQEWLKLELTNFVQRETISSLAKEMTVCRPYAGTIYDRPVYQILNLYVYPPQRYERRRKMQKIGSLGVMGHPRSSGTYPFDRAHRPTTSYLTIVG